MLRWDESFVPLLLIGLMYFACVSICFFSRFFFGVICLVTSRVVHTCVPSASTKRVIEWVNECVCVYLMFIHCSMLMECIIPLLFLFLSIIPTSFHCCCVFFHLFFFHSFWYFLISMRVCMSVLLMFSFVNRTQTQRYVYRINRYTNCRKCSIRVGTHRVLMRISSCVFFVFAPEFSKSFENKNHYLSNHRHHFAITILLQTNTTLKRNADTHARILNDHFDNMWVYCNGRMGSQRTI